ncbi:MAG: tryptophan-rich sensory protein [Elusimicrobiaceae bacterium]|nr:tryptophan-rich sensory protein [Elusimicrobiaceae bacterium]
MLIILIILFLIAGGLSSIFVGSAVKGWYVFLKKPFFAPPALVFVPVWTILYILLAVFYWRLDKIYDKSNNKKLIEKLKGIFILQMVLNFMWTPVFFGLRNIVGGLIIILALDLLVVWITWLSYKIDKKCFYISLIYLVWLLYASALNLGIFILN